MGPRHFSRSRVLVCCDCPLLRSLPKSFWWLAGGNGEVSVLAVEKLQQALRQREDEVAHLQHRLVDVRHNPT